MNRVQAPPATPSARRATAPDHAERRSVAVERAASWTVERVWAGSAVADHAARIALPAAVAAAWWVVAALHREPPVAAEARWLGLVVAAVLYAALQAAPRIGTLHAAVAILLGAIPLALPGTPDRGAAVGVLLAAMLGIAAAGSAGIEAPRASTVVALALGAQLLARGGHLLAASAFDVVSVVGLAVVAALSTLVVGARRGVFGAALAATVAFILGPGFTPMSTLALVVPAVATLAADRDRAPALRGALAAALLAPLAWDLERGLLLLLCAIAFAAPTWARLGAGLAGLAAYLVPDAQQWAGVQGPAWLLVLLPIVAREPGVERMARWATLTLALATAAQSADRAALVAPAVVLAATAVGTRPVWARLQAAWIGILAGAVAVLAAYPWLRTEPLREVIALLGLGGGGRIAVFVVFLLFALAALTAWLWVDGERRARLAPRVLLALLVPLALLRHDGTSALPITRQPVELATPRAVWSARFEEPARVSAVTLDSTLSNAAAVAPGTVVADVLLRGDAGERVLPIVAGVDTGEWAARRRDVAGQAGFAAPPAFLHWVDAGGRFFGQRYRARHAVEPAVAVTSIEVRLAPGVPDDLVLTLFQLRLSP